MTKAVALIAVLQAGLVFSPVVRADDVKPAQVAPAQNAKADAKGTAKNEEHCDCKECAGKHGKKSCKTCKHCKMGHKGHDEHKDAAHTDAAHEG